MYVSEAVGCFLNKLSLAVISAPRLSWKRLVNYSKWLLCKCPIPHPYAAGSTDLGEACSSGMQGSLLQKVWLTAYV